MAVESRPVGVADDALGLVNRWDFHLAHIDRSPGCRITSFSPLLASLFIGCKVKGDEEKEIRAQDPHAGESSELLSRALAIAWQVGEVG